MQNKFSQSIFFFIEMEAYIGNVTQYVASHWLGYVHQWCRGVPDGVAAVPNLF